MTPSNAGLAYNYYYAILSDLSLEENMGKVR